MSIDKILQYVFWGIVVAIVVLVTLWIFSLFGIISFNPMSIFGL